MSTVTLHTVRPNLETAYETLRAELIRARKERGLTQREVAAELGAHQQFWSKVESGERRIDVVELVAVADLLALDVGSLVHRLRGRAARKRSAARRK